MFIANQYFITFSKLANLLNIFLYTDQYRGFTKICEFSSKAIILVFCIKFY